MAGIEPPQKVGASTIVPPSPAAGTSAAPGQAVGKSTLVDALPQGGPQADPDNDPSRPPPDYQALDPDLIQLLDRSRATFWVFSSEPGRKFWDSVRSIPVADLHTLVQITKGAKAAGLWPLIKELTSFYTFPTSWGIEFHASGSLLPFATNGQWGKDFPQIMVRREHFNTQHEWYRQDTGAGNPGLHLGIDVGAGHHNVHWDPTNPVDHVSKGEVVLGPPMGPLNIPIPIPIPKGQAVYNPKELFEHVLEIKGLAEPGHNADSNQAFLTVTLAAKAAEKSKFFAGLEEAAPDIRDRARSNAALQQVRDAAAAVLAIDAAAKPEAMKDDDPAVSADLKAKIAPAQAALWKALAGFFQYLHAEVPGYPPELAGYDSETDWHAKMLHEAEPKLRGLQAKRSEQRAAK